MIRSIFLTEFFFPEAGGGGGGGAYFCEALFLERLIDCWNFMVFKMS